MKKIFNTKVIIVIVIAVLIAGTSFLSFQFNNSPGIVSNAVGSITIPLKRAISNIAHTFEEIYGYMYEYDSMKREIEALKMQISEFSKEQSEIERITEDYDRLRQLLNLKARHSDYVFDTASIISWDASNWSSNFTISKGSSNSDVAVGDSIITETGFLVGRIVNVGNNTSEAVSILDTTFTAGVEMQSNGDSAVVYGDYSLLHKGLLRLDYLTNNAEVLSGSVVATSGKGGLFPKGLIIGNIFEVAISDSGLKEYATVMPTIDLKSLYDVFVITDFEVSE